MIKLDDHAKLVARRNAAKNEKEFRSYLTYLHWSDEEIEAMWRYAKRWGVKK